MAHMFEGLVRLSNGQMQTVRIQADNSINATAMLEAQYGRGSVVGGAVFYVQDDPARPSRDSNKYNQISTGQGKLQPAAPGSTVATIIWIGASLLFIWLGMPILWAIGVGFVLGAAFVVWVTLKISS